MMSKTDETYQQGIMNLQGWLDFLSVEKTRLETQLSRMQNGSQSLPDVDADLPSFWDDDDESGADSPAAADDGSPKNW